jgi:hypothetical protein
MAITLQFGVKPGDTFRYRSTFTSRQAAEVHGLESSYTGPIKFLIELATGRKLRQEYIVGDPVRGTRTLIERI